MTLEHLSYSSISSYLLCAAAWKFHYIDKVKVPTSHNLIFGSAFHDTVESYLRGESDSFGDLWSKSWRKHTEGVDVDFGTSTAEESFNLGVKMLTDKSIVAQLHDTFFVHDQLPKIETKIELRVPGVPIPVIGFIDIITGDGIPGDFKTSARSWSSDKAYEEMQPVFYLAALHQLGIADTWSFRHYIFVKTKTPQFQAIESSHTQKEIDWLFGMIRNVWRAIDAKVYPENPTTWKCNPSWCEYWNICRGK